ncbi:MAG: hypothetical protein FJX92_08845 [Bacteroidetes bacterium]|nr:hypothetical protein [Bacteroidota bacterium]
MSLRGCFLIAFLISWLHPSLAQSVDSIYLKKGRLLLLGEPYSGSKKRSIVRPWHKSSDDSLKYTFIYKISDINSIQSVNINSFIRKSADSNSFEDWLDRYPSKKFYIDSVIYIKEEQFIVCYWVDNRGMLYSSNGPMHNDHQTNIYIVSNLKDAIKKGEIILTNEEFIGRDSFRNPFELANLYVNSISEWGYCLFILLYALLAYFFQTSSVPKRLKQEIANGFCTPMRKIDYLIKAKNRFWEKEIIQKSPQTGLIDFFWGVQGQRHLLLSGDVIALHKYRMATVQEANNIFRLIDEINRLHTSKKSTSKVGTAENFNTEVEEAWDNLDKTIDRNIANQYRILKSKGLDTSHLDDFIKQYDLNVDDQIKLNECVIMLEEVLNTCYNRSKSDIK